MTNFIRLNDVEETLKSSFRTMAVFEFFADFRNPASIGKISTALKIPQSSTSSLVKSLVKSGYLHHNPHTRNYTPTQHFSFLSDWMRQDSGLDSQICGAVKEISLALDQTVIVATRSGAYSKYILIRHMPAGESLHAETGSMRPLICAASGWAMLMNDADCDIKRLSRNTHVLTEDPHWQRTALDGLNSVRESRKNGFAFSKGAAVRNTSGIAMPLPTSGDHYRAAITVAGDERAIIRKQKRIVDVMSDFISTLTNDITEHIFNEMIQTQNTNVCSPKV